MVRKGFLHVKETPSSNLISRQGLTNLIFLENEKHLAETLVRLFLYPKICFSSLIFLCSSIIKVCH